MAKSLSRVLSLFGLGIPEANPIAGADVNPETGELIDSGGMDVTKLADKYGTGPVKRPSFWSRLANPEGSAMADQENLQYGTEPTRHKQKVGLEEADAARHVRETWKLATGEDIDPKMEQQIVSTLGATRVNAGGTGTDSVNKIRQMRAEGAGGLGTKTGLTNLAEEAGRMKQEREYAKSGGYEAAGLSAAKGAAASGVMADTATRHGLRYQAVGGPEVGAEAEAAQEGAAGEHARTRLSLEPQEREFQTKELQHELNTQGLHHQILDEQSAMQLEKETGLNRMLLQEASQQAAFRLKQMPTEQQIIEEANKMALERKLGVERPQLEAEKETAPLARRSMFGEAQQRLIQSQQPHASLFQTPRLFTNTGSDTGDPAKTYRMQRGVNPLYMSPLFKGEAMMDSLGKKTGGGNGMVPLSNGMGWQPAASSPATGTAAPPPSAPATSAIMPPQMAPSPAPMTRPSVFNSPEATNFFHDINNIRYPRNAPIDAIADEVAKRIGPPAGSPALNIGGSTLSHRPGYVYSNALMGNPSGPAGALQGQQIVDYVNSLPADEQGLLFRSAWGNVINRSR